MKSLKLNKTTVETLYKENYPLVETIARKYKRFFPNISLEELISEGSYGLLEAIKHYNKKRGNFSDYSKYWIKKYIRKYIVENYTILRLPYRILSYIKKIFFVIDKYGLDALPMMSKKLNLDLQKIKSLIIEHTKTLKEISLDSYLDQSEQQETFYDILPDSSEKKTEDVLERDEQIKYLWQLLDKLSYEESEVLKWRFGLKDSKHHTIKDVAKKLKLPPHKVKELEQIALRKLKKIVDEEDFGY